MLAGAPLEASLLKRGVRSLAHVQTAETLEDLRLTSSSSTVGDSEEIDDAHADPSQVRCRVRFSSRPEVVEVYRYIHLLDLPSDLDALWGCFEHEDWECHSAAGGVVDPAVPQDEFETGPPRSLAPVLLH